MNFLAKDEPKVKFFDVFFPLGRTNRGWGLTPVTQEQALSLMGRYDVEQGLVYHTVARDCDPELGNKWLERLVNDRRLSLVWALETANVSELISPEQIVQQMAAKGVRAILVNPLIRGIRISHCRRLQSLATLLASRQIPLLLFYRQWDRYEDLVDWYEVKEFCRQFPDLPVIVNEWRCRSNRPLLEALAGTENLFISLSFLPFLSLPFSSFHPF